jgi:hypothetical protein
MVRAALRWLRFGEAIPEGGSERNAARLLWIDDPNPPQPRHRVTRFTDAIGAIDGLRARLGCAQQKDRGKSHSEELASTVHGRIWIDPIVSFAVLCRRRYGNAIWALH